MYKRMYRTSIFEEKRIKIWSFSWNTKNNYEENPKKLEQKMVFEIEEEERKTKKNEMLRSTRDPGMCRVLRGFIRFLDWAS